MPSSFRASTICWMLFLLIGSIPGFSENVKFSKASINPKAQELPPLASFEEMDPEEATLAAYAKIQRLIKASGADISIEILEPRLWTQKQFGLIDWSSIVEYPEHGAISVGPQIKAHMDGQRSLHYSANWIQGDKSWFYLDKSLRNNSRTVEEVLREAAKAESWAEELNTLVTFDVSLRLEKRHRTYRASMLLGQDETGRLTRLHPIDYLLQGVDQAILQRPVLLTDEVVVDPRGLDPMLDSELGRSWVKIQSGEGNKTSCLTTSSQISQTKLKKGYNGHATGSHVVGAEFKFTCSCDAGCSSTCDADMSADACVDTGSRHGNLCHRLTYNGETGFAIAGSGGASCGAAIGCTQVTCSSVSCDMCNGVPVSITGGPFSFNMGATPTADWSHLVTGNRTCPACIESPDGNGHGGSPPDQGGDPSNGGAGNTASPILINLEGGGFFLTGLDDPVSFDIDVDGYAETMGWSTAEGDEAFLVLDRNGNGTIDDGGELFGNYTNQPESAEPNGFAALAVFDDVVAGGNADGVISANDEVFYWLQLWHDRNHDGHSDPTELSPLSESDVLAISLSPFVSERQDPHGNELRYISQVRFRNPPRRRPAAIDVFFVSLDD